MKRKGFTLIELLAVIVILAVIALIATPMILGIIDSAKKSSVERSVDYFIEAVELKNTELLVKGEALEDGIYQKDQLGPIDVKGTSPTNLCLQMKDGVVLQGEFEFDGTVIYYENGHQTKVNHPVTCPYSVKEMLFGFDGNQSSKNDFVFDYSGNGNSGRLVKVTSADFHDGIIRFNGVNQGIEFPVVDYDFGSAITMITRIRFDEFSNINQEFFGNWETSGGGLFLDEDSNLCGNFYINGAYRKVMSSGSALLLNTWYTIALTYDGGVIRLYLDGELVGTNVISGVIKPSVVPIAIGYNPESDGTIYHPGHISVKNAFVYAKAFMEEEIKAHYQLDLANE